MWLVFVFLSVNRYNVRMITVADFGMMLFVGRRYVFVRCITRTNSLSWQSGHILKTRAYIRTYQRKQHH